MDDPYGVWDDVQSLNSSRKNSNTDQVSPLEAIKDRESPLSEPKQSPSTESKPKEQKPAEKKIVKQTTQRLSTLQVEELDIDSSPLGPLGPSIQRQPSPEEKKPVPVPKEESLFEINVTEPLKIGDKISGHVEYRIKTRTDLPEFKSNEFSVTRRFREFVWIYTQLVNKYPGLIIPPVPEKLTIGRFQEEFIESRRGALERFLRRVAAHPILNKDEDFKLFLESTTFADDKKDTTNPLVGEITPLVNQAFPKIPDNQKQLEQYRQEFDTLDVQLKNLHKIVKQLSKQRKEIGPIYLELGDAMVMLANAEKEQRVADKLRRLGNIHKQVRELYEKLAQDDMNYMTATVEDHIRIIGSVKVAYHCRYKAFNNMSQYDQNLAKKRDQLAKLEVSSKLRTDKIASAKADVQETEIQIESASQDFETITERLLGDLNRYELEKVKDFTQSLKSFLQSTLESQQQMMNLWQQFFAQDA